MLTVITVFLQERNCLLLVGVFIRLANAMSLKTVSKTVFRIRQIGQIRSSALIRVG